MLVRFHKVVWSFLFSILRFKFGWKKGNNALYYCGASFCKTTYRYPDSSSKDNLISVRIYKRILSAIIKKKESYFNYGNSNGHAIFDGNMKGAELRFDYVKKFTGVANDIFISKEDILSYNGLFQTFLSFLFLIITFFPAVILSIFSKNKLHFALMVSECLECFYLQEILLEKKIKKINYFCIYERDANVSAYNLMKNGFYVNKIPSEVPLVFWNKEVVANQLSFCFAYQQEEFEAFKETMFVQKTELWAPEQILKAPSRFLLKSRVRIIPLFDIGFFSSGNWLRYKLGDVDLGHNDKENEELLLNELIKYVKVNKLKLKIFTHPLEKRKENRLATETYYYQSIQNAEVSLADFDIPSIEGFDEINIGVSLYSTLMFERLYLGFKTILAPFDYNEFPLTSSNFNNICANNVEQLLKKINLNLELTNKDFFRINNLNNYSPYLN